MQRMAEFEDQPMGVKNRKKQSGPRLHFFPQLFHCACYLRSGINCSCKGKQCEVCRCRCATGSFKLSEFEQVARLAETRRAGLTEDERPKSASDCAGSFGRFLDSAYEVRFLFTIVEIYYFKNLTLTFIL